MELEKSTVNINKVGEFWDVVWICLKILILIAVNIVVFLPISSYILWIIFGVEVLIGVIAKIEIDKIIPIVKFLTINLIPIYLILYFVDYDWLQAFYYFGDFISKIFVLLMSLILFSQITPISKLIEYLAKFGVPKRISFIIVTVITFIPTVSAQLRLVVKSQKARGYKFNLFRLKPILVPVILYLMDLSINLSLSLESRGFEL